jgi:formate dehydrogenase subunit gamma
VTTAPPRPADLLRFDAVTRVVHWTTATLLTVLLVTGTILYVPPLSAFIGRRETLKMIHVVAGLALLVPLLVGVVAGPAGRRLRRDLRELGRWDASDVAWLRRRTRRPPDGKFNGGQKLLTALVGGAFAAQLITGSIMEWNRPFPDDWRTGATFVHDWGYLVLAVLVLGHLRRALAEPELMRAMRRGWVSSAWAEHARPGWWRRQSTVPPSGPPAG